MASATVEKTIEEAQAAMTVKRVFGDPFEVEGVTILPVARVAGAGGGGGGNDRAASWGTGFGLVSQPMGVYVIDAHDAHWVPTTGPNPLFSLVLAPIAFARRLIFGPAIWEKKVAEIPIRVRTKAPARVRATARKRRVHRAPVVPEA